jgi:hypothetical protein
MKALRIRFRKATCPFRIWQSSHHELKPLEGHRVYHTAGMDAAADKMVYGYLRELPGFLSPDIVWHVQIAYNPPPHHPRIRLYYNP